MYDVTKPYKATIKDLIKTTWDTFYVDIEDGTYSLIKKKFSWPEVDHTDGIGTKGYYHWQRRTFHSAVIDALAMNLNDLALVRALPYKIQNHIVLPEDDHTAIEEIMTHMVGECKPRQIAITGGETSIHNNMDSMDLSITMSGFVKQSKPNQFQAGDVLFGLPSSGLHSNGFTKVRELFGAEIREEFTTPTAVYLGQMLMLDEKYQINGLMHITGGAFTKLRDLLSGLDANIIGHPDLAPQQIFKEIYQRGVSESDMYTTFNCGIGFIFSAPVSEADDILRANAKARPIGNVVPGTGKF